jgi:hypothetical protein
VQPFLDNGACATGFKGHSESGTRGGRSSLRNSLSSNVLNNMFEEIKNVKDGQACIIRQEVLERVIAASFNKMPGPWLDPDVIKD